LGIDGKNIESVIIDNLVASSEDVICSAPEVVPRKAGRPPMKRLRFDKSRFCNAEESPTVCSLCKMRGHIQRTCLTRINLAANSTAIRKIDHHSKHWISFSLLLKTLHCRHQICREDIITK
jgi:hypothetical protein